MVTCKQLVSRVAEATGTPYETVAVIDRFLAEAGLRTRSLRGRGQTDMTSLDAARLLFAAVASQRAVEAVHVVTDGRESISGIEMSISLNEDVNISFNRSPRCVQTIFIKSPNLMGDS